MSLTKNLPPPNKKFSFQVQTRRLAASFELLNSSLPFSVPELCTRKATCNPVVLVRECPILTRRQSVKKSDISGLVMVLTKLSVMCVTATPRKMWFESVCHSSIVVLVV